MTSCTLPKHKYDGGFYYASIKPTQRSRKRITVLVKGCSGCSKVKVTR